MLSCVADEWTVCESECNSNTAPFISNTEPLFTLTTGRRGDELLSFRYKHTCCNRPALIWMHTCGCVHVYCCSKYHLHQVTWLVSVPALMKLHCSNVYTFVKHCLLARVSLDTEDFNWWWRAVCVCRNTLKCFLSLGPCWKTPQAVTSHPVFGTGYMSHCGTHPDWLTAVMSCDSSVGITSTSSDWTSCRCVCVWERKSARVCERVRVCVCTCVWQRVSVYVSETESVCVCVCV